MSDVGDRLQRALAGRYEIDGEIGRGGMATVLGAEDLKHSRAVAIKVLHPDLAAAVGPERFLREIEVAARLDHPNILPLFDSGEADGLLYFVMPRVHDGTLRDRLEREGQLPAEEALRIASELAEALEYAHARGVVHRDIKPGNIMLADAHARVADFGIAGTFDEADEEALTATGVAMGSPAYMSPEQASGEPVDPRSDIYSLGCVLYEMLAGEPPFAGSNARMVFARRMSEQPASLALVRDTVPHALDAAVRKCLAVTPVDRYQTAGELRDSISLEALVAAPTLTPTLAPTAIEVSEDSPNLLDTPPLGRLGRFLTTPLSLYLPSDPIRRLVAVAAFALIGVGTISSAVAAATEEGWFAALNPISMGVVMIGAVMAWIAVVRRVERRSKE